MNGAQGRNRTTDTAIFSRMLYQLSYLGIRRGDEPRCDRRVIESDARLRKHPGTAFHEA